MMQTVAEFEHAGSATSANGVIMIDVKTSRGIISRPDVIQLMELRVTVTVYDAEDLIRHVGMPHAIGRAWVTASGRAVMIVILGTRYVAPFAQVKAILAGEVKTAHISFIWWRSAPALVPRAAAVMA